MMENSPCDVNQLALSLCKIVSDYCSYIVKLSPGSRPPVQTFDSWQPPQEDFMKINFDANVGPGLSRGLCVVIRDAQGKIQMAGTRRIHANWSADISEAEAALYGLTLARRMGYKNIHLEGDALNVIVALKKKPRGLAHIHLIFDSCMDIMSSFDCILLSFVRRGGNTAAHMVARWETNLNNERICMSPFPDCLRTLKELDSS